MSRKLLLLVFSFFIALPGMQAQDSLLAALQTNVTAGTKTFATFKSARLINAQTNETTARRMLDFRVTHRFGNFLDYHGDNNGGIHTFYGLDAGNFDIRIAFDYGITDRLMIGVSRSKKEEALEGHFKFRLLEQTTDDKIPVSVSAFGLTAYTPKIDSLLSALPSADRFNHTAQIIIARKFSSRFSLEVIPSWVHRNLITNRLDDNDVYSIGGGARWKITKSFSLLADYFHNFRTAAMDSIYYDPLGIGIEIETGGHVFTLMFTNAQYIIEPEFITNTVDTWAKNGWKFGFNISRVFSFKKKTEAAVKPME